MIFIWHGTGLRAAVEKDVQDQQVVQGKADWHLDAFETLDTNAIARPALGGARSLD